MSNTNTLINSLIHNTNTMIRKYESYIDNSNKYTTLIIIDICKDHVFGYMLVNLPESLMNF